MDTFESKDGDFCEGNVMKDKQIRTEDIDRYIEVIQCAVHDSEKLAGMFVVTHLLKNQEPPAEVLSRLCQAVGPEFIGKLLRYRSRQQDGDQPSEGGIIPLGLNLLTFFVSNEELAKKKEILALIPLVIDALVEICTSISRTEGFHANGEREELVDDSCRILMKLVSCQEGSDIFITSSGIYKLISNNFLVKARCSQLLQIIINSLSHSRSKCHTNIDYEKLILVASKQLLMTKENGDLGIVRTMTSLFSCIENMDINFDTSRPENKIVQDHICIGLMQILQSKVSVNHRRDTLFLSFTVMNVFGIKWVYKFTCPRFNGIQLISLILALAAVEINMLGLPEAGKSDMHSDAQIAAYFAIAEKVVVYLVTDFSESSTISSQGNANEAPQNAAMQKLHFALSDIVLATMNFFVSKVPLADPSGLLKEPAIIAAYRMICAWLSEETEMYRDKVNEIIPVLLVLAEVDFKVFEICPDEQDSSRPSLIQFLLPGLCHLSADPPTRKVLLDHNVDVLLATYFNKISELLDRGQPPASWPEHFETVIGVFLNIAVSEATLIKQRPIFVDIQKKIFRIVPKIYELKDRGSFDILANLVTLGLVITRALGSFAVDTSLSSYLSISVYFLMDCYPGCNEPGNTSLQTEISVDLWLICFDNILKIIEDLKEVYFEAGLCKRIKDFAKNIDTNRMNVDNELVKLIQNSLKMFVCKPDS